MNELEKSRIEKAIHNIFKEDGLKVKEITDNTVTVAGFREVTYKYEVIGDIVKVTNKAGLIQFKRSIRSYQDLDVKVIINK